jgi:hypothetical protein
MVCQAFFVQSSKKIDLEPFGAVKKITSPLGGGSLQGLWAGSTLTYNRSTLDAGGHSPDPDDAKENE